MQGSLTVLITPNETKYFEQRINHINQKFGVKETIVKHIDVTCFICGRGTANRGTFNNSIQSN
jgi:hypothetical protein